MPIRSERVLCVDDEPNILEAIRRSMSNEFELVTAPGGEEGLRMLRDEGPFAVLMTDLRMPVVDGISLLRTAAEEHPDTVRVLLTGHADLDHAMLAVNEGRIFRFLTKPCASSVVRAAIVASIQQHRLITAERVLLNQTLRGSIRALFEMVSLVHPAVGAQTARIRRSVVQMAEALHADDLWHIEIAALLSNLGSVTLPAPTVEKLHMGRELLAHEQRLAEKTADVAARVIANIPRMDEVQSALVYQSVRWDGSNAPSPHLVGEGIPLAARLIRIATDLDLLESRGLTRLRAIGILESRPGTYDPNALEVLRSLAQAALEQESVDVVAIRGLRLGMVLAEDFTDSGDSLLIARGAEVTQPLLDRIREFWDESQLVRSVRVVRPPLPGEHRKAA